MGIIGISFPFGKSSTSFPAVKTEADVVEDNIRRVLTTRRGERPMRPRTGSGVWTFVFENTGALLNARIDYEVRNALAEGEPRATVLSVVAREQVRSDGARNLVIDLSWEFNREYRQTAVTYTMPGSV